MAQDRGGKIVGGVKADIADYPYQIGLFYRSPYNTWYQSCGGAILNHNTILCASHCTVNKNHRNFAVRAGSTKISYGGQFIKVKTIFEHPYYDDITLYSDISILKLVSHLTFGVGVNAIGLPPMDLEVPENMKARITGWGSLSVGGPGPETLKAALVPIVSNENCMKAYPGDVRMDQICAGKTGVVSHFNFIKFNLIEKFIYFFQDACQGDSGGPLVLGNYVIGIVSWGNGCAYKGYPTVYTRVSSFLSFISYYMDH